jgi:hypothetical protein
MDNWLGGKSDMTIKEQVLAELDSVSQDQLSEILEFVRHLNRRPMPAPLPTTLASEAVLARDWLAPEEDAAWQNL